MVRRKLELNQISDLYKKQLVGSDGLKFLLNRGIKVSTANKFNLGYVDKVHSSSWEKYLGSITIPYYSAQDRLISIRFRYINPKESKYNALPGSTHIFNVKATDEDKVFICEGEFDAILLSQLGYAAVAVPGARTFKPFWKYLFAGCEEVNIVMDRDEEGIKASSRLASILGTIVDKIIIRELPSKMDITDLYLKDKDELKRILH